MCSCPVTSPPLSTSPHATFSPPLSSSASVVICTNLTSPASGLVCVNGTEWFANSSQTVNASQLNLTVPLFVLGSLTIPKNDTTVIATYNGVPVLNVTGDADLHGALLLVLGPGVTLKPSQFVTIGFASNLTHWFESVVIESHNGCIRYRAGPVQDSKLDSSFGVLVESAANSCRSETQWWVYLTAGTVLRQYEMFQRLSL